MIWAFTVAGLAAVLFVGWRLARAIMADREELVLLRAKVRADARVLEELKNERDQMLSAIRVLRAERAAEREAGADAARRDPSRAPGYLADSLRHAAGTKADLGSQDPLPRSAAPTASGERR